MNRFSIPISCLFVICFVAPATFAGASLDVRPGRCPNLINHSSQARGVVPIAIVSDVDFSASRVDVDSLQLGRENVAGSVRPIGQGTVGDVAAPASPGQCPNPGADGMYDMLVMFRKAEIVDGLDLADLPSGTVVEICMSGETRNLAGDGNPFEACGDFTVTGFGNLSSPNFDGIETLPRLRR